MQSNPFENVCKKTSETRLNTVQTRLVKKKNNQTMHRIFNAEI